MDLRRLIGATSLSLATIFVLLVAVKCYAELPPGYYLKLQNKAPEYLKIEVVTIRQEQAESSGEAQNTGESTTNIELEAKVLKVVRTQSGIKPGDTIRIKYSRTNHLPGWVGPGEIPVLEMGNVHSAFLTKAEGKEFYEPAARGKSFADLLNTKAAKQPKADKKAKK
jgi:hypothetical protein